MCQNHISFSFRELAWRNPVFFGVPFVQSRAIGTSPHPHSNVGEACFGRTLRSTISGLATKRVACLVRGQ